MSKLNLLVHLNGYEDQNATMTPTMNNFKWTREMQGIDMADPISRMTSIPAGQSLTVFSGTRVTSDDNTTTWDLNPKTGYSNTFVLSHNSGTEPAFRAVRSPGHDGTTQITVTQNASLLTIQSVAGTAFDLLVGGVVVGDQVRLGSVFGALNEGVYTILSRTATSFTIENQNGTALGTTLLGNADQVSIYSASGVQPGDSIDLIAGFSPVSLGTYEVTDVGPDFVEFYSPVQLPIEVGIVNTTPAISIYVDAQKLLYIECDKALSVKLNGATAGYQMQPFQIGTAQQPGIFFINSIIKSVVIENLSVDTATVYYIAAK